MPTAKFTAPIIPGMVKVARLSTVPGKPSAVAPQGYTSLTDDEVFKLPFTEDAAKDPDAILPGNRKNNYFVKVGHIHARSEFGKTGLLDLPTFINQSVCENLLQQLPRACVSFRRIHDGSLGTKSTVWKDWRSQYSHPPEEEQVQAADQSAVIVETSAGKKYVNFIEQPYGQLLKGVKFANSGLDFTPKGVYRASDNTLWTATKLLIVTDVEKAKKALPDFPVKLTKGLNIATPDFTTIGFKGKIRRPAWKTRAAYVTSEPDTKAWIFHIPIEDLPEATLPKKKDGLFVTSYHWHRGVETHVLLRHPRRSKSEPILTRSEAPNANITGLIRADRVGDREMKVAPFAVYDWDYNELTRWKYYFLTDLADNPPKRNPKIAVYLDKFARSSRIPAKVRSEVANLTEYEIGEFLVYFATKFRGSRPLSSVAKTVGLPSRFIKWWGRTPEGKPLVCKVRKDLAPTPPLYKKPTSEADIWFLQLITANHPHANIGAWLMNPRITKNLSRPLVTTEPGAVTTAEIARHYDIPLSAVEDWLINVWEAAMGEKSVPKTWPRSVLENPPQTAMLVKALVDDSSKFLITLMKDEARANAVLVQMLTALG